MLRTTVAATAALAFVFAAASAQAQKALPSGSGGTTINQLYSKAQSGKPTRVIVQLREPAGAVLGATSSAAAEAAYSGAVRAAQNAVIADVFGQSPSVLAGPDKALNQMDLSAMFAINVTAAELARLARDPRVVSIHEDMLMSPDLLQSLGIIRVTGAGGVLLRGATGAGRAVAVLDTGVNKTNEFLLNKVISEACYNTTNASFGSTSRCPGGAATSTAVGSGADCAANITGCGHGTHVAGIAAGKNTALSAGEPRHGVAREGRIVAINVFSRFRANSGNCGTGATKDCVLSFVSDQVKALQRVFALRNGVAGRKIDAINMSLGGGGFTGFCNSEPHKPVIDQLRAAGIATVIASGNSGFINGTGSPGCIQTAITIGSSTKRAAGKPERMSSFTNQGPQVDALAPGGDFNYPTASGPQEPKNRILSSQFNTYNFLAGTSMAAPHVAGLIAAIRSKATCRPKTVTQIENALRVTGLQITDHRTNPCCPQLKERRVDGVALMTNLGCA
jgi:subtilisin family serine protease